MSTKRKNRLVPVTMHEVSGGQTYIEASVDVHGRIHLQHHKFHGHPRRYVESGQKSMRKYWVMNKQSSYNFGPKKRSQFMADCGMDPNMVCNYHRTFRHTVKNEWALQDIVRRQALDEYLTLIGIENVEAEMDRIEERSASFALEMD